MLTTEVTVTDLPEEKKEAAGGMGGHDVSTLKHDRFVIEGPREFFSRAFFFFTGNNKTIGKA